MTFIFRPRQRSTRIEPMLPMPTTPRVLPASSCPWNFFFSHLPALTLAVAASTLRESDRIIASASSATVVAEPPGVFITTTPRRVAAGRSTLSTPTPARPTTLSRVAASSTLAVTLVALRTASPSYWPTIASSSSGLRPTLTSTSSPAPRRMETAAGERSSATRTRDIEAPLPGWCSLPGPAPRRLQAGEHHGDQLRLDFVDLLLGRPDRADQADHQAGDRHLQRPEDPGRRDHRLEVGSQLPRPLPL